MAQHKNHTEINKSLTQIRQGINEHKGISEEARKKAIEKLNVVQSHVDDNKINETTIQHVRDIIKHLEENPKVIAMLEELLAFLPH